MNFLLKKELRNQFYVNKEKKIMSKNKNKQMNKLNKWGLEISEGVERKRGRSGSNECEREVTVSLSQTHCPHFDVRSHD